MLKTAVLMLKTVTIRHRDTQSVLYETEVDVEFLRTQIAVIRAIRDGAQLAGADLRGADLRTANLTGVDLTNADLVIADLGRANLTNASLRGADLHGADVIYTDLTGADITEANLTGANLRGANLVGVDLRVANLREIRDDLRAVLDTAPREVKGLLLAVREGRIDGTTYKESCACLVGTIANVRGCNYLDLGALSPNGYRPAERWFLAIRPGHTPANSQVSAITENWIVEWLRDAIGRANISYPVVAGEGGAS